MKYYDHEALHSPPPLLSPIMMTLAVFIHIPFCCCWLHHVQALQTIVYLFVFVVQQQFIMAVKPLIVACLLLVTYSWAYDGAQVVIDSVNSNPSAKWVAGENSFFESMSLHEIKRLVSCWKGESRRLEDVSLFPEVTGRCFIESTLASHLLQQTIQLLRIFPPTFLLQPTGQIALACFK